MLHYVFSDSNNSKEDMKFIVKKLKKEKYDGIIYLVKVDDAPEGK